MGKSEEKERIKKLVANQKLVAGLAKEKSNSTCADCHFRPSTHASVTYGVFVCESCGTFHNHGGALVKEVQHTAMNELFDTKTSGIYIIVIIKCSLILMSTVSFKPGTAKETQRGMPNDLQVLSPPSCRIISCMLKSIIASQKYDMRRRSRTSRTGRNSQTGRKRSISSPTRNRINEDNQPKAQLIQELDEEFETQVETLYEYIELIVL
jgi:ribosomal protein L37AE/L43A